MSGEPQLSIAIATHAGRREPLGELLDSIGSALTDVAPGRVEVSISDNASDDGTAEMVAEAATALPCELRYSRFDSNRGLAANLHQAIANASGRFCWTVGSDEKIAPEGIARVLAAIERAPDLSGLVVGSIDVDPEDVSLRTRQPPAAFFPDATRFTVYEDPDAILAACGNAWGALSWSVLNRRLWLSSAEARAELVARNPVFPQVIVMAGAALDRPRWGWEPAVCIHRRGADPFVFESAPVSMARKWAQLLGGCCDAWADVLGGRNRRWRRQVRRVQRVWGRVEDARGCKLYERPSLADQLALLAAWSRSLWPCRAFWRELLPALLAPARLTRRLHGVGDEARGAAPPAGGRPSVELEADLPGRVAAGGVSHVAVRVRNVDRTPIPGTGPTALGVWQRWRRSDEEAPLRWEELGVNELASQPVDVQRRLRPGASSDVDVALMAPTEPGRYELTVAAHRHGIGWLDLNGTAAPLRRRVEVV